MFSRQSVERNPRRRAARLAATLLLSLSGEVTLSGRSEFVWIIEWAASLH